MCQGNVRENQIVSRSGRSQEILKKCQKIRPFDPCQGIDGEFCHVIPGNCQKVLL